MEMNSIFMKILERYQIKINSKNHYHRAKLNIRCLTAKLVLAPFKILMIRKKAIKRFQ